MNTFNRIMGVCITILISIMVFFLGVKSKVEGNPNNLYQVYLNGDNIGLIKDKEKLLDLIDKEQSEIKAKYKVDKVYPPSGLDIQSIVTYDNDIEKFFTELLNGCKGRARRSKKFNFDLTLEQVLDLYEKQNHKCALSGLEMTTIKGSGRLILNASIDRIDPGKDYSISNIRLVCNHVNMMRSNLSDEELLMFCKNIVENSNK